MLKTLLFLGLVDNYYEDPNYESYDMGSPVDE